MCAKLTKKWFPLWCLICIVFFFSFIMSSVFLFCWGPLIFLSLPCPTTPQVKKVSSVVLYSSALAYHLVLWIHLTSRCLESHLVAIQCWYPLSSVDYWSTSLSTSSVPESHPLKKT